MYLKTNPIVFAFSMSIHAILFLEKLSPVSSTEDIEKNMNKIKCFKNVMV